MAPPQITSPANSSSAGYGRSCTNCSKAKCKCILRADGMSCERCYRLQKNCQPMISARTRTMKKTASSRAAQLEEKLDDLVSILRASQSQQPGGGPAGSSQGPTASMPGGDAQHGPLPPPPPPPSAKPGTSMVSPPTSIRTSEPAVDPNLEERKSFPSRLDSLATAATSSPSATARFRLPPTDASSLFRKLPEPSSQQKLRNIPEKSVAEADACLSKFRTWMYNVGFLYIPEHMTSEDIRRERPFLYSVIMCLTSMSVPDQQVMTDHIRKDLANRMVFNGERTMDILVGLICYLTWAHYNAGPTNKQFLLIFAQMGHTIVQDMGLTKDPSEDQLFTSCFKPWPAPKGHQLRPATKPRTMEERRAVLALYYLTSVIYSFTGKNITIPWTAHMQTCLETLEQRLETPSDEMLGILVRLQKIGDEAQTLLIRDAIADPKDTPTYVLKKGILAQLKDVQDRTRPGLLANSHLQGHFFVTEMQVQCIGIFGADGMPEAAKIEGMYNALKSARAWYDLFLSMPMIDIPGMPFSFFNHYSQTQVVLFKLTVCEDPAWDKSLLRSTADLMVIFDRSIERFLQIQSVYPMISSEEAPTIFAKGAMITRNVKQSWEPAIAHMHGGIPTPESQATSGQGPPNPIPGSYPVMNATAQAAQMAQQDPNNVAMGDYNMFEFGDVTWMSDIFGPWEYPPGGMPAPGPNGVGMQPPQQGPQPQGQQTTY